MRHRRRQADGIIRFTNNLGKGVTPCVPLLANPRVRRAGDCPTWLF